MVMEEAEEDTDNINKIRKSKIIIMIKDKSNDNNGKMDQREKKIRNKLLKLWKLESQNAAQSS